jgi:possible phosphoprotein phosphatase
MARLLFLLAGAPGSGKTTWIDDNEQLTGGCVESWDAERARWGHTAISIDGREVLSLTRAEQLAAINTVAERVRTKMARGDTIFIDNTNTRWSNMKSFVRDAQRWGYTVFLVDVQGDLTLEELKERNRDRIGYKRVPDKVVERHYRNHHQFRRDWRKIIAQSTPKYGGAVAGWIHPKDVEKKLEAPVRDFSGFERVMIVGDVQGCGDELEQLINRVHGETDPSRVAWVFTGDLFDRGQKPRTVYDLVTCLRNRFVVCGNHEVSVLRALNNLEDTSYGQSATTVRQLLDSGLTGDDIRRIVTDVHPVLFFTYKTFADGEVDFMVTHAGVNPLPFRSLKRVDYCGWVGGGWPGERRSYAVGQLSDRRFYLGSSPADVTSRGVSAYSGFADELDEATAQYDELEQRKFVQVFGHRRAEKAPNEYRSIWPLESGVEFAGGCLTAMSVTNDGIDLVQVPSSSTVRNPRE